jgi:hypothetical protein
MKIGFVNGAARKDPHPSRENSLGVPSHHQHLELIGIPNEHDGCCRADGYLRRIKILGHEKPYCLSFGVKR